jgi:phage tail-like protein
MRRIYLWPFVILCSAVLASLAFVPDDRLCGQDSDITMRSAEPSESFVFQLELDGQGVVAEYSECFGLGSSNQIEEAVVQTNGGAVKHKTPGALEWHDITLRREASPDEDVLAWREAMEDGRTGDAIRNGAIVMFKLGWPDPLARWNFSKGWPARLTIEGSVQELTIVHDGLERVPPSSARPPVRRPTEHP